MKYEQLFIQSHKSSVSTHGCPACFAVEIVRNYNLGEMGEAGREGARQSTHGSRSRGNFPHSPGTTNFPELS